MAYNLYHESLRENYGMSDLLRHLRETEDVIFKRRDDSRDDSREQHKTEDEFRTYIPEENKAMDGIGSVRPIYEHVGKEDSKEHFTEEKYTGRQNQQVVDPSAQNHEQREYCFLIETVFQVQIQAVQVKEDNRCSQKINKWITSENTSFICKIHYLVLSQHSRGKRI